MLNSCTNLHGKLASRGSTFIMMCTAGIMCGRGVAGNNTQKSSVFAPVTSQVRNHASLQSRDVLVHFVCACSTHMLTSSRKIGLQASFSPSVDLVSHESVRARHVPSPYLEAGHFGGLGQLRSRSLRESPAHPRHPITQPPGSAAACADAKTQTVCEASAQVCLTSLHQTSDPISSSPCA